MKTAIKIITKNKRASFDYHLDERVEAGLVLKGTEVKGIRLKGAKIDDAYVLIDNSFEAWIYNMRIAPYEFGNIHNHQEERKKKLLLHKNEIMKLREGLRQKGQSIVPVKLYFKNSNVKIEIALARGKKLFDKRQDEKKKDALRDIKKYQDK